MRTLGARNGDTTDDKRMSRIRRVTALAGFWVAIVAAMIFLWLAAGATDELLFCSAGHLGLVVLVGAAVRSVKSGTLNRVITASVGIAGICCGFFAGTMAVFWYAGTPWPAPRPIADQNVLVEETVGSWGYSKFETYTITLHLDDVHRHYESQMAKYCVGTWEFEPYQDEEYAPCVRSGCQIRRWGLEQFFEVHMCAISETESIVSQVSRWQD